MRSSRPTSHATTFQARARSSADEKIPSQLRHDELDRLQHFYDGDDRRGSLIENLTSSTACGRHPAPRARTHEGRLKVRYTGNVKPSLRSTGRRLKKLIYPYLPATLKGEYEGYRFAQRTRVPNTVYLETTSACNLNCVMCAAQRPATKAIKPSGYMDLSLFKRLVDEIARELPSIEYVYLHKDGEPLLHPDIVEMIQYASSRHPNVTLVPNATLLDERMALSRSAYFVTGTSRFSSSNQSSMTTALGKPEPAGRVPALTMRNRWPSRDKSYVRPTSAVRYGPENSLAGLPA